MKRVITQKVKDRDVVAFRHETIAAYQKLDHTYDRLVVLYNDLHNDNMAFDQKKKRLNGIFDFGDVAVGDIHLDFHPLYKFNQSLVHIVFKKRRINFRVEFCAEWTLIISKFHHCHFCLGIAFHRIILGHTNFNCRQSWHCSWNGSTRPM